MTREQRAELARQVMAATAERETQQRQRWADEAKRIAQVWAQCVPLVPGDPVTLYLKRRGFGGVWPLPELLRLHRALPYWHGVEKLGPSRRWWRRSSHPMAASWPCIGPT